MVEKTNQNERALVERAKRDPAAFSALYRLYFSRIFGYVSWRVGSRSDAEDLVSEIFTKVLSKLDSFRWKKGATFSSWIFRIAHNTVVDYYRSKTKREFVSVDDLPEIQADELLPDELSERRRLFKMIFEQVQELPPRQAEIITMRFFGEMRNKEIAKVLEIEERTVSSSLLRGLTKLHDVLN
jgi:RNA polymerase sigma-70 factor (ECF subfamily)